MQLRAADFDDYPELQELARKYGMVKNPKSDQLSYDFVCKVGHSIVCPLLTTWDTQMWGPYISFITYDS